MCRCAAEASASRRPKDMWPPETCRWEDSEKEKAIKELLALNEPRSSIYCSIVHVIWQQTIHGLQARGENENN